MIRTITFELKTTPNHSIKIYAVKALRDAVPGLTLKDGKEACDIGVFRVDPKWANTSVEALRPYCVWVNLDESVHSFDDSFQRLSGVCLRLTSRLLNKVAALLETIERKL